MAHTTEIISGTCRQLLFSPKGEVEGVLMTVHRESVQVNAVGHASMTVLNTRCSKPSRSTG
ncbi:MAG: hypothetical protein V4505_10375 [Pseudomonadota bacterium]